MKNLSITIILSVILSVCLSAQSSQQKLNQGELMKKFVGTWQSGNGRDTVKTWEMKEFNNAFMQTYWQTINGVSRAQNMCYYAYDKTKDCFNSFALLPNGQLQTWNAKFASEKEASFDRVGDLKEAVVLSRTTVIFDDNNHFTINSYNDDKVRTGTSKWVRTSASLSLPKPDANVDQLTLMQLIVGQWRGAEGNDREYYSEITREGNIFTDHTYNVIKGERTLRYTQSIMYSEKEGRFRSFVMYPNGNYSTYMAAFNSDKKWIGSFLKNFNPNEVTQNWEMSFTDPDHMVTIYYNQDGSKPREIRWNRIK